MPASIHISELNPGDDIKVSVKQLPETDSKFPNRLVGEKVLDFSPKYYRRERSRSPPQSYRREHSLSPRRSYRDRSQSPRRSYRERSRSPLQSYRRERSRSPPQSYRRERTQTPKPEPIKFSNDVYPTESPSEFSPYQESLTIIINGSS